MGSDAISEVARHLRVLDARSDAIDILIVSNGGDPTVSWRVVSMIREQYKKMGVLLPFTAYSAATLLALGADEIVMHPFANLGPVDPQLMGQRAVPGQPNQREAVSFGSEDLRNFLEFVRDDVGITDQEQLQLSFSHLVNAVGALPIGVAKRGAQLALSLGEKLLSLHMKDRTQARAIAESLNKSFYHHGYPVGRAEAKQIGLPITNPKEALEELMWRVWEDFEQEMKCNEPFDAVATLLADSQAGPLLAGPTTQVAIPANLPPNVLQQAYNSVLQQIQTIQVPPVKVEIFNGAIETDVSRSHFRTEFTINGARRPDMSIGVNMVVTRQGWAFSAKTKEEAK